MISISQIFTFYHIYNFVFAGMTLNMFIMSYTFVVHKSFQRVDDISLFDCLSPFCFLLIEFIVLFPFLIKYYHSMCIIIVFRLGNDR